MSFLENPFADDEEAGEPPILAGSPFGDYDVTQRENEYNAMLVQCETLEGELRQKDEKEAAQATLGTRHTTTLRESVRVNSGRLSVRRDDTTPANVEASQQVRRLAAGAAERQHQLDEATLSVLGELERTLEGCQTRGAQFQRAASLLRRRAEKAFTADDGALGQGRPRPVLTGDRHSSGASSGAEELRYDTSTLEGLASRLVQLQADAPLDEEGQLTVALLQHVHGTLSQHLQLVAATAEERDSLRGRQKQLVKTQAVAAYLATVLRARADEPAKKVRRGEASPTQEQIEARVANDALSADIRRTEAAIVRLAVQGGSSTSVIRPECAAAAQLAALQCKRAALQQENERIGQEILFMRDVVLARAPADSHATALSASVALTHSTGEAVAADHPPATGGGCGALHQELVARMRRIEAHLQQHVATVQGGEKPGVPKAAAAATPQSSSLAAQVAFAEQLIPVQASCLAALHSINQQLQSQAGAARLLERLVLHTSELGPAALERLCDVPAPQLPETGDADYSLDDVGKWYLAGHKSFHEVEDESAVLRTLTEGITNALRDGDAAKRVACEQQRGAWQGVMAMLRELLSITAPVDEAEAALQPPSANGDAGGAPQPISVEIRMGTAVAAEMAELRSSVEGFTASVTSALEHRRKELENKLTWFNRQPHAARFKALKSCCLEHTKMTEAIRMYETVAAAGELTQKEITSLQQELVQLKTTVTTMEANVVETEKQIAQMKTSIHSLSV